MRVERRDHFKRAETLRRVVQWLSGETSPAQHVPSEIAAIDIGRRILKRMALQGLVRQTGTGWVAQPVLREPAPLHRVANADQRVIAERRGDLPTMHCRRCHKSGVVRHETVVQGTSAERHFYCGICSYRWKVKDRRSRRSAPPLRDRADEVGRAPRVTAPDISKP